MNSSTLANPLGNLSNVSSIGNWAEAVDQESRDSVQKRVEITKDGLKTVIDYIDNEEGGRSKVITTYKVIHKKVPRVVAERKKWKKFGAAKDDEPGPNINTTYVADDVEVQFINRFGDQQDELDEKMDPLLKGQASKGHCRFCKADDHWSVACPYKGMFQEQQEDQEAAEKPGGFRAGPPGTPAGRYVPPSQRAGAPERTSLIGGSERHSDDYTVRITNLPEDSDTLEEDLRSMFSKAGRIVRFYLARDKNSNRPKGFAFVTFSMRNEAENAIDKFNGAKMEHLILKVEWTKPSN